MKNLAKILSLGTLLTASAVAAHASPLTGQFSLDGSISLSGNALTYTAPLRTGAAVDQTGSFATLLTANATDLCNGAICTGQSFSYSPYAANSQVWDITENAPGDYLLVTINSFSETTVGGFQLFSGTATLVDQSGAFSSSPSTFGFTSQGTGSVTFSATVNTVAATPEPSSLVLLGTGLLGAGGTILRRRRSIA